jgi:bacterioferritin-associated ferredoxin
VITRTHTPPLTPRARPRGSDVPFSITRSLTVLGSGTVREGETPAEPFLLGNPGSAEASPSEIRQTIPPPSLDIVGFRVRIEMRCSLNKLFAASAVGVTPMNQPCTPEACDDCSDKVVCRCLQVTEAQVVRMITRLELRTVRDVRKMTGAGEGCTCCHAKIQEYIERYGCETAAMG